MKNTTLSFIFLLISVVVFGQSVSNKPPNKTVVRLIVVNENGELLMKESSLGWVTIASFYTQRQNFNEVIDSLTNTYGLKITTPSLGGIFTYQYNFKKSADTRLLYVAKYIGGEIKQGKNDYYFTWFPKDEAIQKLKNTVPSLGEMIEQILNSPDEIWGGSFFITRDAKGKLSSQMTEDFYSLHNAQNKTQQSNYALIEKTLYKYIEGSSYNKLELLESAFTENATLYLTGSEGFKRYTPKEYVSFFKNRESGKFNGRHGKILSIEITKDIASAKVEITIPERKMVYIDVFLLKKTEKGWLIISKTATRVDENK